MESDVPATCSQEMIMAAARAVSYMEKEAVDDISTYVQRQITPDGGFRGRAQASDLYYCVFGTGCLTAMGGSIAAKTLAGYLARFGDGDGLDFVHLTCLARCLAGVQDRVAPARLEAIIERIEAYRSVDGGYHHVFPDARQGSAYASFLALLAHQDLGQALLDPQGILRSIGKLKTSDGGYANEPGLDVGTTTATAAAVIVRVQLGEPVEPTAGTWLLARACQRGGFLASASAPAPDLLSTATALFALRTAGASLDDVSSATGEFVEMLWDDGGGFCGHAADPTPDCEYTFYALLALGCLDL